MWASILASLLKLIESFVSIWKTKEEVKKKEFEVKNTEEQVRRAELVIESQVKDEAEKLVKDISTETDNAKKEAFLNDLRRRVSS
jgi:hypothetical protein